MQPSSRLYKRTPTAAPLSAIAPGPVPADSFPRVDLSRDYTDDNTDDLTRATVHKMCALIRDSATDPRVQQCAAYAKNRFASGSSDPAALAWGVFWYVKHCVKFRSDEGTMMQVGEQALDLLTAPAVLVRMKDPSEDCDGFTMLSAAMLTILGVTVYVTTVAVDLDDPRRWSHVFLCAVVNGRVMPLDTSHGKAPGWMVPTARINRWQTWTLDGRPADVKMPNYRGLHGYVQTGFGQARRRWPVVLRGMGQACSSSTCIVNDPTTGACTGWDDSSCSGNAGITMSCPPGQTADPLTGVCTTGTGLPDLNNITCPTGQVNNGGGICVPISQLSPIAGTPGQTQYTPAQWAAIVSQAGTSAVNLIRTAAGGPYQVAGTNLIYNPATGMLTTAAGANQVASMLAGGNIFAGLQPYLLPIGGVILAAILLPSLLGRK